MHVYFVESSRFSPGENRRYHPDWNRGTFSVINYVMLSPRELTCHPYYIMQNVPRFQSGAKETKFKMKFVFIHISVCFLLL